MCFVTMFFQYTLLLRYRTVTGEDVVRYYTTTVLHSTFIGTDLAEHDAYPSRVPRLPPRPLWLSVPVPMPQGTPPLTPRPDSELSTSASMRSNGRRGSSKNLKYL